jgi:hypothetical protein
MQPFFIYSDGEIYRFSTMAKDRIQNIFPLLLSHLNLPLYFLLTPDNTEEA